MQYLECFKQENDYINSMISDVTVFKRFTNLQKKFN